MKDFAKSIVCNKKAFNSSHTKEEAKTKDEYFKILKFYQTQGYKTKAGDYNPNGRIKLYKGDDSVEIVLVGNKKVENATIKFYGETIDLTKKSESDLKEILEELQMLHEGSDEQRAIKEELRKRGVGNSKVGNSNKIYQDANVTIYDDGIVELDYFRGYTQYAKDVDSIVRDEIRGLEKQIYDLKKAADKVKEIGRKYKLL